MFYFIYLRLSVVSNILLLFELRFLDCLLLLLQSSLDGLLLLLLRLTNAAVLLAEGVLHNHPLLLMLLS